MAAKICHLPAVSVEEGGDCRGGGEVSQLKRYECHTAADDKADYLTLVVATCFAISTFGLVMK